jgi:uncharacterized protein with ParB-like and HNH nuclease domain
MSEIKIQTIRDICNEGEYVIPIYQRGYAWTDKEISQLVQDIWDYVEMNEKDKSMRPYYIGTLVVNPRKTDRGIAYETIDGQQRLTTLNMLVCALHNLPDIKELKKIPHDLNLRFDSRENSTLTLQAIYTNSLMSINNAEDCNVDVKQGYLDIVKAVKKILGTTQNIVKFYKYLVDYVHILRVPVPEKTDLNHYFEIMNSRGEQLEKHEVLKARLLSYLKKDPQASAIFSKIWVAVSDMERYVQYGFLPSIRKEIFGKNLNTLVSNEDIYEVVDWFEKDENNKNKQSIRQLVNQKQVTYEANDKEVPDRFTSVISFPNFLLQVLRVLVNSDHEMFDGWQNEEKDIPLDDKRLLDTFQTVLIKVEPEDFVNEFGYALLRCRFLFDKFIIKRQYKGDKEDWSLLSMTTYDKKISYKNTYSKEARNKQLIMLLSMFHVSAPTQIYKHWLSGSLNFCYSNVSFKSKDYIAYLGSLAEAYLYDRYLAIKPYEFYTIIYNNNGLKQNNKGGINESLLDTGTQVENFVFNYLDYKLWKEKIEGHGKFEFASRTSVEHYFPQRPVAQVEPLDPHILDNFGNLCLLSRSKNSTLSNYLPEAKRNHYMKVKPDSLKQKMMMDNYDATKWGMTEIEQHRKVMLKILLSD